MPTLLTKSKFLAGLTCPRYFWMLFHEPDKIPEVDEETQFRFSQGHLVGGMAKRLFPGGVEVPRVNFRADIKQSQKLLAERKLMFEAGFVYEGCYAKADVLKPIGKGEWDIIEVKSSARVKEDHVYDLAFQKRCYDGAGLTIRNCFLMHINGKYERHGDIELKKFFEIEDITKEVADVKEKVEKYLTVLFKIMASDKCPVDRCASPKSCPVPSECWGDLPDDNVFTLYYAGKKAVEMYQSGIVRIQDIPSDYPLNGKQKIQKEAIKNGKAYTDGKALSAFISKLKYPLHFLDFETFGTAVPLFDGVRPYQAVPFQFSLHIVEESGAEPQHSFFLSEGTADPRHALLERLQKVMKQGGSVVVYNQSFENGVLLDLAKAFPENSKWVQAVLSRVVDLLVPFRSFHYYHPEQNGSASIKRVLPVVTGDGYSELDITKGDMASLKYLKMTYQPNGEVFSKVEVKELRKALEAYCAMDTKGMAEIVKKLSSYTGNGTRKPAVAILRQATSKTASLPKKRHFTRIPMQQGNSEITPYHAKYFAHELTKKSPSDSIEKFTRTLSDAQVDLNPHQIDAALFAFKSPLSKGAILADEVGLGKTIEAGILLSQKWAEGKRKLLIICPSSLRKQWSQELYDKFFQKSRIIDSQSFKKYKNAGKDNPFEQEEIVICSYHFAKNKEEYIQLIRWDLTVLDEAHKLRNVFRNTNKISQSIKNSLSNVPKILLTATPLQNSLLELYGLVSFIDEHTFGDLKSYKSQFVRLSDDEQPNYEDLKSRLEPICKRTLRRQVLEYIRYTNRIPITQEYIPTDAEQELYDEVSKWLQKENLYSLPSGQRHLMTLIMRRLLASSTFAIAGTLKGLIAKLKKALETGTLKDTSEYIKKSFSDMDEISEELEDTEDDSKPLTETEKNAIREEIRELQEFSKLAESIKINAKGNELQTALERGFAKLKKLKGPKKALIFTEFRRTQDYIYELLSNTKYKDEIVIYNGTNNDEKSNKIYAEWLEKNKDTDNISGSSSADKRAAIVDYFKNNASIMIATEAAAEGINLQFCSLVVNYDLPWNPQRIEQRIGRCHRYGQNYDVVVINFLNQKNEADKRVFELLDQKFKLFNGVFGASDEVLGTIDSGIDFEKRISKIYQECRTTEEIIRSFDQLQKELEEQISASLHDAKKKLLENFDEEVHEKLRVSLNESKDYLNRFEKMLWQLTLFELSECAQFDIENSSFILKSDPFKTKGIMLGKYKLGKNSEEAHLYRIGLPLAQEIIKKALNERTPPSKVVFDYSSHKGKISCIEELKGQKGSLALRKLKLTALDEEEYLIFTAKTDNGKALSKEQCERLFDITGKLYEGQGNPTSLEEEFEQKKKALINSLTEKNNIYFDEEMTKFEKWGDDRKNTLKQQLKELDENIKIMKKENRLATNLQEKLKRQRKIRELDNKRDRAWKEYEEKKKEIDNQVDKLIDQIQAKMEQRIKAETLFAIRWEVI